MTRAGLTAREQVAAIVACCLWWSGLKAIVIEVAPPDPLLGHDGIYELHLSLPSTYEHLITPPDERTML